MSARYGKWSIILAAGAILAVLPACAAHSEDAVRPAKASAVIGPTQPGSQIMGKAVFEETADGLKIHVDVQNAPAGNHGFHIHMNGDCSAAGNAAGGHFNPDGVPHGNLARDGFAHAHAGDLGNLTVGTDGHGTLDKLMPGLTLKEGKYGVAHRSLILHEKVDDFGQPTGNAGGRIACGVIRAEE